MSTSRDKTLRHAPLDRVHRNVHDLSAGGHYVCALPPRVRSEVAGRAIPGDVNCYRVVRKADYVTVEYAIGGPTRRVQVLLRLDKVVGDADNSVRLFSERVVESKSIQCDSSNASCFDTVLVTDGPPNEPLQLVGLQFEYTNPTVEYEHGGVARYRLNLAGEMYARARLPLLPEQHTPVRLARRERRAGRRERRAARARDGRGLRAHKRHERCWHARRAAWRVGVYQAYHGSDCVGGLDEIDVFPVAAASEVLYLSIVDPTIYETEPTAVVRRREIVELGYACAATLDRYERGFNMYDFDCNNAYAYCRPNPSLPYRRVSTHDVRVHYTADDQVYVWLKADPSLKSLPGLADSADAVLFAMIKLGMLILAAAVMWVRSDRVTSASYWLYRHCIRIANCQPIPGNDVTTSVIEDAALGLTACGARAAVAIWRWNALASEDQSRVCFVELVGAGVSFASWVVRFWVIEPNLPDLVEGKPDTRGPLTRLGGSMAIVDASCAVLLAFAEPPIHLSNVSRFDDTARLLGGLVIALVTLQPLPLRRRVQRDHARGAPGGARHLVRPRTCFLVSLGPGHVGRARPSRSPSRSPTWWRRPWPSWSRAASSADDAAVGVAVFMALVCVSPPATVAHGGAS